MERLHKLAPLLFLMVSCCASLSLAQTPGKCSLVVRVLSPDGRRPETTVSVREHNGRVEEKDQDESDVRFCDLGILPVDVTVGGDGAACNRVTVHDVPVFLTETYLLHVTYDPSACRETIPPPVPVCYVLFRISDLQGQWLQDATVSLDGSIKPEKHTDEYGRADLVVKVGTSSGSVKLAGFRSAAFSFKCERSGPIEQWVRLQH